MLGWRWRRRRDAGVFWSIFYLRCSMDVMFLLIPISVLLVFGIIGVFWWALQSGQFDNIEREGQRILRDD
jgi:cbb3-type cytochrome oxidase maturation protein